MKNGAIADRSAGLIVFVLAAGLSFFSCKPKDDTQTAITNEMRNNNSKEAKFLVEATAISLREIELAKLAQSKGGSENIKEMGKRIEADNVEFLKEIKKLAALKSISI